METAECKKSKRDRLCPVHRVVVEFESFDKLRIVESRVDDGRKCDAGAVVLVFPLAPSLCTMQSAALGTTLGLLQEDQSRLLEKRWSYAKLREVHVVHQLHRRGCLSSGQSHTWGQPRIVNNRENQEARYSRSRLSENVDL